MRSFNIYLTLAALVFTSVCSANPSPVVSDVRVSQRNDNSKLVDIYYNLADEDGDACTIWVSISDNDGANWRVPAMTFIGDVGADVSPGTDKHVIWDAGRDIPGKAGSAFKARVYADDGTGDSMVLVVAGAYKVDGSDTWQFVNGYKIDKYEVTNAKYCEFLNEADLTGQYWNSSQEIARYGSSGSYYYVVLTGRDNYPVRYVSYNDATAYAAWKSQKTGLNYHLPDKYQWQKAAAWDPDQQKFWSYGYQSTSFDCSWSNYRGCKGETTPVGYYDGVNSGTNNAVSYYGCYDMSGNLSEWTTEDGGSKKICRGGDWDQHSYNVHNTFTPAFDLSYRYRDTGFRLVMDWD